MIGELILSGPECLAVTNEAEYKVLQQVSADFSAMTRTYEIDAKKLFTCVGELHKDTQVEGVFRFEAAEIQVTKYFSAVIVSLSKSLCKIRLSGELQDSNVNEFLQQIKRYEFSR